LFAGGKFAGARRIVPREECLVDAWSAARQNARAALSMPPCTERSASRLPIRGEYRGLPRINSTASYYAEIPGGAVDRIFRPGDDFLDL
jgi:hypothetical protein